MKRIAENVITIPLIVKATLPSIKKYKVTHDFSFNQFDYFIIDYAFNNMCSSSGKAFFDLRSLQDAVQIDFADHNISLTYLRKRLYHINRQSLAVDSKDKDWGGFSTSLFTSLSLPGFKEDGEDNDDDSINMFFFKGRVVKKESQNANELDEMPITLTFHDNLLKLFTRYNQIDFHL